MDRNTTVEMVIHRLPDNDLNNRKREVGRLMEHVAYAYGTHRDLIDHNTFHIVMKRNLDAWVFVLMEIPIDEIFNAGIYAMKKLASKNVIGSPSAYQILYYWGYYVTTIKA